MVIRGCVVWRSGCDKVGVVNFTPLPGEGYWKGGTFTFQVQVPEEYNNKVSTFGVVLLGCV